MTYKTLKPEDCAMIEACKLYTIGYEGKTLDNYLAELTGCGISTLCDVRRNAVSRKPGFSKRALVKACSDVSISYEHVPELGISSKRRKNIKTLEDYSNLFIEYALDTIPLRRGFIGMIKSWILEGENVALTCYERLPILCHRQRIADAVTIEFNGILNVVHLGVD